MGATQRILKEFTKFGIVGVFGIVIDVGLFNFFIIILHFPSIPSKISATAIAMMFTFTGNKLWSFRTSQHNVALSTLFTKPHYQQTVKEIALFLGINIIALSFSIIALYITNTILGYNSTVADNIAANIIGLGLGTLFRFVMYKKVVFHPTRRHPNASTSHHHPFTPTGEP